MPIGVGGAILGAGALSAGSGLLGAGKASSAAKDAANAQMQMFQQTQAQLAPYNVLGQTAATNALALAQAPPPNQYLTQAAASMPLQMTQAQLEQTPGYQFDLSQGLKATQGAAAARGLGVSGASLKGAATYATGLASNTYQQQFNNAQQNFTNLINLNTGAQGNLQSQFGRLSTLAGTGENAAAQTGTQGTTAAAYQGQYLTQGGQAAGAGLVNAGNVLNNAANNYLGYNLGQQYLDQQKPTGGYTPPAGYAPASFANPNTGYTIGGFQGGNTTY